MSDAEIASTAAETVTVEPTTTEEKMEQEPVVEKTENKEEEEKEKTNEDKTNEDKTNEDKKAESEESTEMETTEAEEPAKGAPSKKGGKKPAAAAPAPSGRGRKRKATTPPPASPEKSKKEKSAAPKTPATNKRSRVTPVKLTWQQFCNQTPGDRVLSCGEGEQLGHPGRTTTKKPRKVDIVEEDELNIVQVVAGGVHSAMLTVDGDVYACGINEKGTVPAKGVEAEGSTDEFTQIEFSDDIKKCGKMVMLTAGASFTAALTDKGDVIAWGNLRDSNGEVNVHPLLAAMKLQPTVIVQHKYYTIVKIAAGENHLAMLTDGGQLLTFGEGSMGQLGRSNRTSTIRANRMVDETGKHLLVTVRDPAARGKNVHFKDVHAAGFWTMVVADDGRVFSFGLNNFSHLGVEMGEQDEETEEHAGEEEQQAAAKGEADDRELRVMLPKHAARLDGHPWTHLQGVQHVIARADNGDVYAIGKNTDNALGLGTWSGNDDTEHWRYTHLEKIDTLSSVAGVTAKLGSSIAWRDDGTALAWGCDTSGQLGLGLKDDDDKVVPKPEQIESAHLNGFKIVSASMADNHTLFLVVKE